jgi:hypothetical protein
MRQQGDKKPKEFFFSVFNTCEEKRNARNPSPEKKMNDPENITHYSTEEDKIKIMTAVDEIHKSLQLVSWNPNEYRFIKELLLGHLNSTNPVTMTGFHKAFYNNFQTFRSQQPEETRVGLIMELLVLLFGHPHNPDNASIGIDKTLAGSMVATKTGREETFAKKIQDVLRRFEASKALANDLNIQTYRTINQEGVKESWVREYDQPSKRLKSNPM